MLFNFVADGANPLPIRAARARVAVAFGGEPECSRFNEWSADREMADGQDAEDGRVELGDRFKPECGRAHSLLLDMVAGDDIDRDAPEFEQALAELPGLFRFGFGLVSADPDAVAGHATMLSELGTRVAIVVALAEDNVDGVEVDVHDCLLHLLEALPDWLEEHPSMFGAFRVAEGVDMEVGALVEELRALGMAFDQAVAEEVQGSESFEDLG